MPAALAAAVSPSMSAPCSVARRKLNIALNPIFLISATADGVTAPAHATVLSRRAKVGYSGDRFFLNLRLSSGDSYSCHDDGQKRKQGFHVRLQSCAHERVASLLRAVDGNDSRRHHASTAPDTNDEFVVNSVGVAAGRLGDGSSNTPSGDLAHGKLYPLF